MPEKGKKELVINTGPIIALVAALGDLSILKSLYSRVVVPYKVCQELTVDNASRFAVKEFQQDSWLEKPSSPIPVTPLLKGILDPGEAAVIQVAANESISTVCIDEPVGRRVARMSGLLVTGSLGILLRAKREGHPVSSYTPRPATERPEPLQGGSPTANYPPQAAVQSFPIRID